MQYYWYICQYSYYMSAMSICQGCFYPAMLPCLKIDMAGVWQSIHVDNKGYNYDYAITIKKVKKVYIKKNCIFIIPL